MQFLYLYTQIGQFTLHSTFLLFVSEELYFFFSLLILLAVFTDRENQACSISSSLKLNSFITK